MGVGTVWSQNTEYTFKPMLENTTQFPLGLSDFAFAEYAQFFGLHSPLDWFLFLLIERPPQGFEKTLWEQVDL